MTISQLKFCTENIDYYLSNPSPNETDTGALIDYSQFCVYGTIQQESLLFHLQYPFIHK